MSFVNAQSIMRITVNNIVSLLCIRAVTWSYEMVKISVLLFKQEAVYTEGKSLL
jgi:hypothetical protein